METCRSDERGDQEASIVPYLLVFSRVLRDSISRYVGRSVGRSVGWLVSPSVTRYFFGLLGATYAYFLTLVNRNKFGQLIETFLVVIKRLYMRVSIRAMDGPSIHRFLDASSHLYKRVCLSVRRSVSPRVGPSVTSYF